MRKLQNLILAMLLPVASHAMEWSSGSYLWQSSELLNVGKSHISLAHQFRSADQRINQDGESENIGRSSRQKAERGGRTVIREFAVKMRYERWTPTWAYGLSPNWTFMAALPMTRLKSEISENVRAEGGRELDASSREEALRSFQDDSGIHIASAGEYNNMRVGRFEMRSKHRIFQSAAWKATFFETIKFPTLEKTQVDFVAYPDPLPRGFGGGLGLLLNARIASGLDLVVSSEYLHQFDDEVYGRTTNGMPTSEPIERDPGAELHSRLGAEYEPKENLKFSAGYSYQGKEADEYAMEGIQEAFDSEKHSVYLGLAYIPGLRNTKRLGQTGFSAALGYESLLQGENIEDADTLSVEMQMTF